MIESAVKEILKCVGEDPSREGLQETPGRVAKAWSEWTQGYSQNAAEILKTFEDGASGSDEMVVVKNIPFYSHCEHHMVPFFGEVTIAYIPNGKIVGLSKLSRLVEMFAKRLQVQERFTNEIADAITKHLDPVGVGVSATARHLCMESRGICKQGSQTKTFALRGDIKTNAERRKEFMQETKFD